MNCSCGTKLVYNDTFRNDTNPLYYCPKCNIVLDGWSLDCEEKLQEVKKNNHKRWFINNWNKIYKI